MFSYMFILIKNKLEIFKFDANCLSLNNVHGIRQMHKFHKLPYHRNAPHDRIAEAESPKWK